MSNFLDASIVEWITNAKLEHHLDYLEHRFNEIDAHYASDLAHVEKEEFISEILQPHAKMKSVTQKKLMAEHERSAAVLNELKTKVDAGGKAFCNEKNNTPAKETIEIDDENSSVTSEDSVQIIHPSKLRKTSADAKICSIAKSNKIKHNWNLIAEVKPVYEKKEMMNIAKCHRGLVYAFLQGSHSSRPIYKCCYHEDCNNHENNPLEGYNYSGKCQIHMCIMFY